MPRYEYVCNECEIKESQDIPANDYGAWSLDGKSCKNCDTGKMKRIYAPFTFRMRG
jgi:hypothetical protein